MHVVATMPMSPKHAHDLGFYSIFVYAQELARNHCIPMVIAMNETGIEDPEHYQHFRNTLDVLGVEAFRWWRDTEIQNADIQGFIEICFQKGLLIETLDLVRSCACGKVQYRSLAVQYSKKRSLINGNRASCCGSEIEESERYVLLTAPMVRAAVPEVMPTWGAKDLLFALDTLAGRQLLVSRVGSRRYEAISSATGRLYSLDNDIVWMAFGSHLWEKGIQIEHLISGVSTMRQAAVLTSLMSMLGITTPRVVHLLPRVEFQPVRNVDSVEKGVERFGQRAIYMALAQSAHSARKVVSLHGSAFARFAKQVRASPQL